MSGKCKILAKNKVMNRIIKTLNRIKHVDKGETGAMKVDTNQIKCDSNQPCLDKG